MTGRKIKKVLGKSVDWWKNRNKEVFEFEQKPIKFESPPDVLYEKQKKTVEAEASAFEKYHPIGSRK